MRKYFKSFREVIEFANRMDVETSCKAMPEMTYREKVNLRINRNWILGISYRWESSINGFQINSEEETACVRGYKELYNKLLNDDLEQIMTGFYAYQGSIDRFEPIQINDLRFDSLEQQIWEYTGQRFTKDFFRDVVNRDELSSTGLIIHKKTGQHFYIPSLNSENQNQKAMTG